MKSLFALLLLSGLAATAAPVAEAPLAGHVVGPDGRPPHGATAELLAWTASGVPTEPAARARLDAQGGFRLRAPVTPLSGLWQVRVLAPGLPPLLTEPIPLLEETEIPVLHLKEEEERRPAAEPWPLQMAGRVIDQTARKPIAGALVWADDEAAALWTRTDQDGRFVLAGTSTATRLRAAAAGYLAFDRPLPSAGPALLPLRRACRASGQITDAEGRPIPDAKVLLSSGITRTQTTADERGSFRFGPQAAGSFDLEVQATGFRVLRKGGLALAGNVDLGAFVLQPVALLAGRVRDETGEPVAGAALFASRGGQGAGSTQADAAGRFSFAEITPEPVRLTAFAQGFLPEEVADLEAGPDATSIEVVLRRGAVLTGRVTRPSGEPAAGARVMLLDNGTQGPFATLGLPQATADDDGRYRLEGVAPGERRVRAALSGLLPDNAQLAVRDGTNRLDLHLGRGAAVSGRAVTTDGEPVARAQIFLFTLGEQMSPASAQAAADGTFSWPAVAAGSYRLEAEFPGFTAPVSILKVEDSPLAGFLVRFAPAGSLRGRILGLEPGEAESLELLASAPGRRDHHGRVEPDGSYLIEDLAPGSWIVVATVPGTARGGRGAAAVAPGPGESFLDLEIGGQLPPPASPTPP
ncbi:MAG TPA: carboxypeptidase-like regulatory domain-containing protein [Thermoanaerobaculia bacterium]|jgi:protocatechuate 3,4-dioxygenase beta subunit|nr:carboxypeptidase-like regulatory domain-containing protein [Thermoanaerobaculia bacterium]